MNVNAFVIRNVHKHVYDIIIVSEEGTGLNRRWSKESIDVIYCIGGRDRVEPEVIGWEYCCYLLYRRKGPG